MSACFTKDKQHIALEIFSSIGDVRERLRAGGFAFREEDVYSNQFWGKRFVVDRPRGRGAQARIMWLFDADLLRNPAK